LQKIIFDLAKLTNMSKKAVYEVKSDLRMFVGLRKLLCGEAIRGI